MHPHIILALPFIAAMCYGLGYVLIEKALGVHINMASFLILGVITSIITYIPFALAIGQPIEFSGMMKTTGIFVLVLTAAGITGLGGIATFYAIRHTSALYTALAETSYPLFTMAFGFLLFGIKQLNFITFMGGLMVLAGAIIMIYGQKSAANDE